MGVAVRAVAVQRNDVEADDGISRRQSTRARKLREIDLKFVRDAILTDTSHTLRRSGEARIADAEVLVDEVLRRQVACRTVRHVHVDLHAVLRIGLAGPSSTMTSSDDVDGRH